MQLFMGNIIKFYDCGALHLYNHITHKPQWVPAVQLTNNQHHFITPGNVWGRRIRCKKWIAPTAFPLMCHNNFEKNVCFLPKNNVIFSQKRFLFKWRTQTTRTTIEFLLFRYEFVPNTYVCVYGIFQSFWSFTSARMSQLQQLNCLCNRTKTWKL